MQKDTKSLAGVEHREWHNLYGMYMQRATAEGLLKRNDPQDKRPFVLSRSFYSGSQRRAPPRPPTRHRPASLPLSRSLSSLTGRRGVQVGRHLDWRQRVQVGPP